MKKIYTMPMLDITIIESEDIITASSLGNNLQENQSGFSSVSASQLGIDK